jgi:hypothetical protein
MGFIGAHADIGRGLRGEENAIPLLALNWILEQDRDAGVALLYPLFSGITSVLVHDKSHHQYCVDGPGCSKARSVQGRSGGTQRQMTDTGMTYTDTAQFISYLPPGVNADGSLTREPRTDHSTGTVDMTRYLEWLRSNGYQLGSLGTR